MPMIEEMDIAVLRAHWRFGLVLTVCAVFGWYAFVQETRVPLLGMADLGFHELGHLLTYPFPDLVTAMMGSGTQILVPLGLAAYFFFKQADPPAGMIMLAWAATSMQDASVYIADAPYQYLPLIGGHHDWAFVLGRLDLMGSADTIAAVVKNTGLLLLVATMGAAVAIPLASLQASPRRRRSPAAPTGIVREARYGRKSSRRP